MIFQIANEGRTLEYEFKRGNVLIKLIDKNKVQVIVGVRKLDIDIAEMNHLIEAASELRGLITVRRRGN